MVRVLTVVIFLDHNCVKEKKKDLRFNCEQEACTNTKIATIMHSPLTLLMWLSANCSDSGR